MEINVKKIDVVITGGTNKVFLYTDLPSPYADPTLSESAVLKLETSPSKTRSYLDENFPNVPVVWIHHKDGVFSP